MKNKKILITGGAGFVGSHTADKLLEEQVKEIVIVDNFIRGRRANTDSALSNARVTLIKGDIKDRTLLNEIMKGINYVFDIAALRIRQCAAEPRLCKEIANIPPAKQRGIKSEIRLQLFYSVLIPDISLNYLCCYFVSCQAGKVSIA